MTRTSVTGWLCTALFGAALLAVSGCDGIDVHAAPAVEGTFERTLTVSGPVDLDIRTGSGDIQIRAGSADSVHVTGRIRARDTVLGDTPQTRVARIQAAPPVTQSGNSVRIGDTEDKALYQNVSISYEVVVPANTKVQAHSGSGNIGIAMDAAGVNAHTGSGNINVLGATGALEAQTGSGNVRAGRVAGAMTARTGSGNIEAEQTAGGPVEMQTGSGNVTVKLPSETGFTLNIQTGSGSIRTSQPVTSSGSRQRNHLDGTVRGGGPSVHIRTGSGDVTID